ncbi:MAG: hypothetical protein A3F69_05590 [Acidobacteria bacterium RIFCSPLOWO2_12_FULL_66_10]|nr:MAG: hypothetical protein A3F69_05590 [Acidobacteria bacterium RIFCSPLOWO2_12_FULL_66_10]
MSVAAFLQEFEMESAITRRVLERVPSDKLSWKPHAKSMSLGHLAMHIATGPGLIAGWALKDSFVFTREPAAVAASTADVLAAHDASAANVKTVLNTIGDAGLGTMWSASAGGKTLMTMPKAALVRSIVLNHLYHHRGQLSVYLRLLDVPVPSIYGPSADENPWA